jgi:predicted KAP-like P-loop ATPase
MWSDREADRDLLGYTSYVNVLADVCTHQDLAPLTLGIFGSWGSGKTSLMKMLKCRIDEECEAKKTKTLWFNAWRYEGREEAQSALIHAVLAKLTEDKTLAQDTLDVVKRLKDGASILKLAKFIGKTAITMTPDLGGFIDCFREESEKIAETMESFDKDFEKLLERSGIDRVVVFIDDLDRCSSAKVIETFETIKLFLNTPKCTFVIGADADKIEHAVGEVYKVDDGRRRKDYLEKIVQIPFNIPEQALRDIGCYVGMLIIGRYMADSGWPDLVAARPNFYDSGDGLEEAILSWPTANRMLFGDKCNDVVDELKAILPYTDNLARGLRGNPRQIKRFLNIIAVRRKLAEQNGQEIEPDLLVKLGVLEYVWEDFFNSVVETVDPSTGHSQLIEEVMRGIDEGTTSSDSKLVSDALAQVGLVSYLSLRPLLSGVIDLRPYLFLAQTSLSRGRATAIAPVDEEAKGLVSLIASDDRLRSKAAAKRAASKDPAIAAAVIRLLVRDLPVVKEATIRTHVVTALEEVCRKHPSHFSPVIKAIESLDPSEEAVALAASSFLTAAEKADVQVPPELAEKFRKSSKLVEALAVPKKPGRRIGGGGP